MGTSLSVGVTHTVLKHAVSNKVPIYNYGMEPISKLLAAETKRNSKMKVEIDKLAVCDIIGDCSKTLPALVAKLKEARK